MIPVSGVIFLVFAVSVLAFIGLYVLIRDETANPTVVDRHTAERQARERGGLQQRGRGRTDERVDDREARTEDGTRDSEDGPRDSEDEL